MFVSDWNELFTTKCFACGFPVEAGDRWVEALNNNYHSQCFNCTVSIFKPEFANTAIGKNFVVYLKKKTELFSSLS